MLIRATQEKISLQNDIGATISFKLSQPHIVLLIKKNIDAINEKGCQCSIEKVSQDITYLILDNNYKLIIPSLTAYEILSKMQLLNYEPKVITENIIDED